MFIHYLLVNFAYGKPTESNKSLGARMRAHNLEATRPVSNHGSTIVNYNSRVTMTKTLH